MGRRDSRSTWTSTAPVKEIRAAISRAIDSSPTLRNKKDLIEQFVDSLNVGADVDEAWRAYIEVKRIEELDRIIAEENLKPDATRAFVDNAFRDGAIASTGTAVTKILRRSHASPTATHTRSRSRPSSTSLRPSSTASSGSRRGGALTAPSGPGLLSPAGKRCSQLPAPELSGAQATNADRSACRTGRSAAGDPHRSPATLPSVRRRCVHRRRRRRRHRHRH